MPAVQGPARVPGEARRSATGRVQGGARSVVGPVQEAPCNPRIQLPTQKADELVETGKVARLSAVERVAEQCEWPVQTAQVSGATAHGLGS